MPGTEEFTRLNRGCGISGTQWGDREGGKDEAWISGGQGLKAGQRRRVFEKSILLEKDLKIMALLNPLQLPLPHFREEQGGVSYIVFIPKQIPGKDWKPSLCER